MSTSPPKLFFKNGLPHVTVAPDGCWLWNGSLNERGYGKIKHAGKRRFAHRHYYEMLVGPVPPGLCLDHLCRRRRCVRPTHLEPVTQAENVRRGAGAKLTVEKVKKVRRAAAAGIQHSLLAAQYGVSAATITSVVARTSWADVEE